MFNLPQSTEFNKRIPKQKFYDNLSVTPAIKRIFVEQIKTIHWANKIAATTVNVAEGEAVKEIEVFIVSLTKPELDEKVLHLIDKEIPYHILFLLEHNDKYQAWIGYKEKSDGNAAFKSVKYFHTDWLDESEFELKLDGFDLDSIYSGFVRRIAEHEQSNEWNENLTLGENVADIDRVQKLKKEIERLEKLARKETQPKKKFELVQELNKLKRNLING